ncbi:MAG TPA: hypothetical protein PKI32_03380 [Opitutales bacterium]|nr:hypothetical protein [Opitutales bacterium]
MEIGETQFAGAVLAAATSLMGAYLLTLKIREAFAEKPDPKLTYATKAEVERLHVALDDAGREWRSSCAACSSRSDTTISTIHELIRRNAEHIAVLIAQGEMLDRRLTETTTKVERLGERVGR